MGVGCAVGTVGAVNVGVGLNESLVGLQKIGYAMSSEGYPIKGTAAQEYTRLMNNQGFSSTSSVNSASIFNPIGSAIIALGGTEQDYNDFSFLTGVALGATATYKQYYEIYKPYYEAYATSRMYGNQVNNVNSDLYYQGRPIYTASQLNQLGRGTNATPNRGIEYMYETPAGKQNAQEFQWGTTGSMMQK